MARVKKLLLGEGYSIDTKRHEKSLFFLAQRGKSEKLRLDWALEAGRWGVKNRGSFSLRFRYSLSYYGLQLMG